VLIDEGAGRGRARAGAVPGRLEQLPAPLPGNGAHSTLYPGVLGDWTTCARAAGRSGCLTNKPLAFARPLLQAKGLAPYFGQVFGGDSFERKKPDPLPLQRPARLGSAPTATLMIGDSSNDAQAARAAGCPVLLVSYGYNHGQPIRAVDADGYVDSLAELRAAAGLRPDPPTQKLVQSSSLPPAMAGWAAGLAGAGEGRRGRARAGLGLGLRGRRRRSAGGVPAR
jgi:hypothetical protein